ncbi:MAG: pilus assembly protein [Acidobacteria bacterium]|nr:pilus assembly protein [Acidobacteriota bacterium]
MKTTILRVLERTDKTSLLGLKEDGGTLVEMAISCLILIPMLFGIIQLSIALYCHHYAADAAREATRFAIVRGVNCATYLKSAAYCSPTDNDAGGATANDIAQYVKGLGYPYSASAVTTVQWCTAGNPATWTTCSTTKNGNNIVGNQVQVKVTYSYPLVIPYIKANTLLIGSTSSMTIVQ